ncbi:exported hypothetical protein [Candidatus Zixiibacteriota bacterium]|nr:exported hypothetical protein [candidate division Zixibacteria bacterium]
MFRTIFILIISALLWAVSESGAVTLHVPADYINIQDAINASVSGDTVLVAPGRYAVNLNFYGKNIVLTSEAGRDLTFLDPGGAETHIISFTNGESAAAVIDGFTFGTKTFTCRAISVYGASPTIRNNIFRKHHSLDGSSPVLFIGSGSNSLVTHNLFYDNTGPAMNAWIEMAGAVNFVNNTIFGGTTGLMAASASTIVRNNIITGCQVGLYSPGGWTVTENYNDIWGNSQNYSGLYASPFDISADPFFLDTLSRNFYLHRASACIDAGHPSLPNDLDGTRIDIGALPFDQRIPSAYNLNLGSEDIAHVLNHTPTIHWMFYDTVNMTQAGYEIEVGTDKDWASAETWQSGQIITSDTFAIYSGTALENGITYYFRIRVSGNGTDWGAWTEAAFTMNAPPEAPDLLWPLNQLVSIEAVRLIVRNSFDANGDEPYYDFQIFSDPGLTQLAISEAGVTEQLDSTRSSFYDLNDVGTQYWWRARAGDQYDVGEWSSPMTFTLRNPISFNVRTSYPTIQAGIDSAQERDTVLVAPGTYTGDGNRDLTFRGKRVILKSESGPEVTIIDCEAGPMNAHWGFYLHDSEDTLTVIDGFTIKNSFTDELGAIFLIAASPTIRNCIITENDGSGIYGSSGAKPVIDSCIISNNTLNGINFGYMHLSGAVISNSLIKGNGMNGIWIFIYPGSSVFNCTFVGNGEAGIFMEAEPPKAMQPDVDSTVISNCLIAYNKYGIYKGCCWFPVYAIRCNDVFGNDSGNFVSLAEHGEDEFGNLELNPQFCDYAAGDYHISAASPCAPANNSCAVLMGTFGIECLIMCGDLDGSGVLNILDISFLIQYLYKHGPEPDDINMADVNNSGAINILDVAHLINYLYKSGPALDCP